MTPAFTPSSDLPTRSPEQACVKCPAEADSTYRDRRRRLRNLLRATRYRASLPLPRSAVPDPVESCLADLPTTLDLRLGTSIRSAKRFHTSTICLVRATDFCELDWRNFIDAAVCACVALSFIRRKLYAPINSATVRLQKLDIQSNRSIWLFQATLFLFVR
jgi:hypothetical protein